MKKNISSTFVYSALSIEKSIPYISKVNGDVDKHVLKKVYLDQILHDIKFKINFPTKNDIVDQLVNGSLVFVEEPNIILPAWSISDGKGNITATVVNLFGKIKAKEDILQFNVREVFGLAQIGLTLKNFYLNESKICFNNTLVSAACAIYVRMLHRIIDSLFSLETIPLMSAQTRYLLAKFFMLYMVEREDNETTDALAYKSSGSMVTLQSIKGTLNLNEKSFNSLPEFLETLSDNVMILKDLDITSFMRKIIMSYGERSLLMLENYNYFLAIVINSSISGGYVKDYALEGSLGKDALTVYNNFFALTK